MKISWNDLFAQIKAKDIGNVYLFTGPEAYVKEQAMDKLRQALLPEGLESLNETVLEGATAQTIIEACETLPFMCDKRLVVVRDWAPLMPGKSRNEADEAETMTAWLANAPDSCCLVFLMRDQFDGRKKMSSALSKAARAVSFNLMDDPKLYTWIRQQAKALGCAIEPTAVDQLVFLAGRALTRLNGELNKLSAYAGQGHSITRAMVDELVPPSLESTVFQMIDSLMDKRPARAIELTQVLIRAGETRIGIIAMLTRQLRLLTHMKLLKNERLALPAIEKRLILNHYAATRMDRQLSRYTEDQLKAGYRACVNADYAIKSGRAHDEDALPKLLLELGAL